MIEILYKNESFIAVYKTAGMPSQSDTTGDEDAMSLASRVLSQLGEDSRLWLVHRLDRVVGGVLLFARSKGAAAALSALFGGCGMKKEYLAVVPGGAPGGHLVDYLYKDARQSKAFVVKEGKNGAKRAELEYAPVATKETEHGLYTLVRVKLYTGRFHQIRVQFSSRGTPLTGDGKYGSRDNKAKMPALFAFGLAFVINGKRIEVKKLPDGDEYPWSLFNIKEIGDL